MTPIRILIVATSNGDVGNTGERTGLWLEELTTPYYAFLAVGAHVDIASIEGGEIPVDPKSQTEEDRPESVARFLDDSDAMNRFRNSLRLDRVSAAPYAAIFLPGGHGTMWDLPESGTLANLVSAVWSDGGIVAAVCHGPSGLVSAKDGKGRPLVEGRRISAFSRSEERAAGMEDKVPFILEDRLRELGAEYASGPDSKPFALRDGRLVTGQNPASSSEVARLALSAIGEERQS